jgi:hypothetical protein
MLRLRNPSCKLLTFNTVRIETTEVSEACLATAGFG